MFRLDAKTKDCIFKNIINGCKYHNFDYIASFDKNGRITGLKIINNKVTYNISDIGIMGVSLLVKKIIMACLRYGTLKNYLIL